MLKGLPQIKQAGQLCEGCMKEKQHRKKGKDEKSHKATATCTRSIVGPI